MLASGAHGVKCLRPAARSAPIFYSILLIFFLPLCAVLILLPFSCALVILFPPFMQGKDVFSNCSAFFCVKLVSFYLFLCAGQSHQSKKMLQHDQPEGCREQVSKIMIREAIQEKSNVSMDISVFVFLLQCNNEKEMFPTWQVGREQLLHGWKDVQAARLPRWCFQSNCHAPSIQKNWISLSICGWFCAWFHFVNSCATTYHLQV